MVGYIISYKLKGIAFTRKHTLKCHNGFTSKCIYLETKEASFDNADVE